MTIKDPKEPLSAAVPQPPKEETDDSRPKTKQSEKRTESSKQLTKPAQQPSSTVKDTPAKKGESGAKEEQSSFMNKSLDTSKVAIVPHEVEHKKEANLSSPIPTT